MGFQRHRAPPRRRLIPGVGLANNLLYQWRHYLPAVYHRRRGRVVIFDRYSYDVLTLPEPEGRRERMSRRLMAYSCPRPDLVLLLDAPAQLLRARKPDRDLAGTEHLRLRYLNLVSKIRGIKVLDTSQDPDETRRRVMSSIWRAYTSPQKI
jgi:thymidylate kinase